MADYGKSNLKLNKQLQVFSHDDWFHSTSHQSVNPSIPGILNRDKLSWFADYLNLIGYIAQIVYSYPDIHPKQANAYFQGMKKA